MLNEALFNVDYNIDNCKDRFTANLSFTFLHWRLMEYLEHGHIDVDSIDLD